VAEVHFEFVGLEQVFAGGKEEERERDQQVRDQLQPEPDGEELRRLPR
jgi:hypothetical protein